MATQYVSADWQEYQMDYHHPHEAIEPIEREIAEVDGAIDALQAAGVLAHGRYDHEKMLAHRRTVAEKFEIPWTAISGRMQRLIYAINAIHQPATMLAAGVFCGNTFISNAGAAVGPGACYQADRLIGVEILPEEADRAERNVRSIDATGIARVVAQDAIVTASEMDGPIDLLYLDADGKGKAIYLDILRAALGKLPAGALVLAHNSVNAAGNLADYLSFVRDERNFKASVNMIVDGEGLEVSVR